MIVRHPMILAEHLRLHQTREQFAVQEFIPETTVERFTVRILPWTARRDVQGSDATLRQELPNRIRDELRTIVAANVFRHPAESRVANPAGVWYPNALCGRR